MPTSAIEARSSGARSIGSSASPTARRLVLRLCGWMAMLSRYFMPSFPGTRSKDAVSSLVELQVVLPAPGVVDGDLLDLVVREAPLREDLVVGAVGDQGVE